MEINKQLFEDVLSGKLKGTFVLHGNNTKVNSKELKRNNLSYSSTHPYRLLGASYNSKGKTSLYDYETLDAIVDFIPDTNMKENELTIEIPDGKIVDWDESKKQNKIVFKKPNLSYGDICRKLFGNQQHYHITQDGHVEIAGFYSCDIEPNAAKTRHQLECILAKNKLANVAKYLNDGCNLNNNQYYVIIYCKDVNKPYIEAIFRCSATYGLIVFKSVKLAQQAIEILGEETVKLALEPLGI